MKIFQLGNGQTLMIRDANMEDAAEIIDYINQISAESDFLTFGEGEFGITIQAEAEFIKRILATDNQLMILALINDVLVGHLSFAGGARPRTKHVGEFGLSVRKDYWGLGVGRALGAYMIDWARKGAIVRKINLRVRSDNQVAINLYRSLDFVHEGTTTRGCCINGEFFDFIQMGLEID